MYPRITTHCVRQRPDTLALLAASSLQWSVEGFKHQFNQCSRQNFEIGGAGVECKALVSNPAPILCEHHYCAIGCCVLACV